MAINAAYVINVAPELATEPTIRIDFFIAEASKYVQQRIWGSKSDYARALFTAHLMLSGQASVSGVGGGGVVQSESVGDLSVSYSTAPVTAGSLGTTKYGSLFEQLRRTLLISPIVVS